MSNDTITDIGAWYREQNRLHAKRTVTYERRGRREDRARERERMQGRTKPVRVFRVRVSCRRLPLLGRLLRAYARSPNRRRKRAWDYALSPTTHAAAARLTAEREETLRPVAVEFGMESEVYAAACERVPNPVPRCVELAIARGETERGARRVALTVAVRRLHLVKQRDELNRYAAGAEDRAKDADAIAERSMRDGRELVHLAEAPDGARLERLFVQALEARDLARQNVELAAGFRAQAAQLSIKIGKTPGGKTRRERIALAHQVGSAAA